MPFAWNPQTGRMEDENGNPQGAVPLDQMQPAGVGPLALAQNQRAGGGATGPLTVIPPAMTPADEQQQAAALTPPPPLDTAPTAPAPAMPAPPGGMARQTEHTTTTREVPTKREGALLGGVAESFGKLQGLAGREGELGAQQARAEATGAENAAQETTTHAAAVDQTIQDQGGRLQAAEARVAADRAKYDAEVKRLADTKLEGYYDGNAGWGKIIGHAIAVAFGEMGRIFSRSGHNTAIDAIKGVEDRFYHQQKAKIEHQKDIVANAKENVAMSREGVTDVRQGKHDALADEALQSAARLQGIQWKAKAESARIGTEHAVLEGQKLDAQLEQAKNERLLDYEKSVRAKVAHESVSVAGTGGPGAGGKAPTESQAKLALLAQQMKGELATIMANPELSQSVLNKMQQSGSSADFADRAAGSGLAGLAGVTAGRALGVLPKSKYEGLTPQEQTVANAWDNAIEKYARVLTGAGMPVEEAHRLALQDAPHAGDSPVVVAQKLSRMNSFSDQAMSLSGPAAGIVAPAAPGVKPSTSAAAAPAGADDQAAIDWANGHKADPRAKKILQLHGM